MRFVIVTNCDIEMLLLILYLQIRWEILKMIRIIEQRNYLFCVCRVLNPCSRIFSIKRLKLPCDVDKSLVFINYINPSKYLSTIDCLHPLRIIVLCWQRQGIYFSHSITLQFSWRNNSHESFHFEYHWFLETSIMSLDRQLRKSSFWKKSLINIIVVNSSDICSFLNFPWKIGNALILEDS